MTKISDLLDIIHLAIIKESPEEENKVVLAELEAIDKKLNSGELPNYEVKNVPLFRTVVAKEYKELFLK